MALHPRALPVFPWDTLEPLRQLAASHPGGIIDLSVGTPVDPAPRIAMDALAGAANSPGYPPTGGTPALQDAIAAWWMRRRGVAGLTAANIIPTIGSKELVALLPALLGLGEGDVILHPRIAYPTYDVGARLCGATPVPVGPDPTTWPDSAALVWLNSPSNPGGHTLDRDQLAEIIQWARQRGAVVVNDECYAELNWATPPENPRPAASLLEAAGGNFEGVLALYSLSKQSNLAGYRAAFAAGDPALIGALLEVRKHAGFMPPAPVQAAMVAVLGDDAHVAQQRERYRARREQLLTACEYAGLRHAEDSTAGLYLWLEDGEGSPAMELAQRLAQSGILVAPGTFYGPHSGQRVRMALTGSDSDISNAAARLHQWPIKDNLAN